MHVPNSACRRAEPCTACPCPAQVNMLAREYCDDCKPKRLKPVILSHAMMPGLLEVGWATWLWLDGRLGSAPGGSRGRQADRAVLTGPADGATCMPFEHLFVPSIASCCGAGPGKDEQERPQLCSFHGGHGAGAVPVHAVPVHAIPSRWHHCRVQPGLQRGRQEVGWGWGPHGSACAVTFFRIAAVC